jgi:hypothetical protein
MITPRRTAPSAPRTAPIRGARLVSESAVDKQYGWPLLSRVHSAASPHRLVSIKKVHLSQLSLPMTTVEDTPWPLVYITLTMPTKGDGGPEASSWFIKYVISAFSALLIFIDRLRNIFAVRGGFPVKRTITSVLAST